MITVKVSELLKMAQDLSNDGIEYVEITELDADEMDGETIPPALSFSAYDGFGGGIDYESIEHIDVSWDYKSEMGLEP
ncbi:MAG TPA: hypothetical protein DCW90_02120 [Lachnospiraceae bacterium]|nr:hypothetical protein [Lachnospiraceae bacterium]